MSLLILGCGNEFRGDDAAGILAARRFAKLMRDDLTIRECSGEGADLVNAWEGYENVVIIDALKGNDHESGFHLWNPVMSGLPAHWRSASTHSFGVVEAVELARVLGRLPKHLVLVGVVGRDFTLGARISELVSAAVDAVVDRINRVNDLK